MSYVFFDLDRTLIRAQSQRLLIGVLHKRKMISFTMVWKLRFFYLVYKMHIISENHMIVLFQKAAQLFKGVDVEHMRKISHAFVFAEFSEILNLKAMEELEKHISAGKKVVLTSAAFEPIVEAAAKFFHIPEYISTKLKSKNGVYTGELLGTPNYGAEKVSHLEKYDFTDSFAYSDHHSDLPLLLKATYRFAVTPSKPLRNYAKSHGWFIID